MANVYLKNVKGYGYGKRPLWQWILLYAVIAGVLYGFVYYFVFAGRGYKATPATGNNSSTQQSPTY